MKKKKKNFFYLHHTTPSFPAPFFPLSPVVLLSSPSHSLPSLFSFNPTHLSLYIYIYKHECVLAKQAFYSLLYTRIIRTFLSPFNRPLCRSRFPKNGETGASGLPSLELKSSNPEYPASAAPPLKLYGSRSSSPRESLPPRRGMGGDESVRYLYKEGMVNVCKG